ncbi:amino acid/amide ABC transporter membrane protein 2, HAAT family (TC 3.A.1.4.-) [Chelatococcus sambhunathii]|uniref:Branched-chain amino acid ABC transporter permease n=2 Tax=Chelatococcus TaxID=28209 RepID=A0AAC9NZM9_9HYPH|nr:MULTISPECIES: high-affinity branched-chain amino acid ABC transporter permease LivM [Chelatococcus]APF38195.1 branched-chain amino acid ABC transporter permease [Chelatococcus daeguensis]CUA84401.1 amino acid/amide ABC transporter membrane protein 2, HAAT family (TC 3.A.1.4.-) [Chelatococcus sambhunathii]
MQASSASPVTDRLRAALREAAIAGIIMIGIALPLVGFRLQETPGQGLGIAYRFDQVVIAGVVVAIGRFLVALFRPELQQLRGRLAQGGARTVRGGRVSQTAIGIAACLLAFALPFLPIADRYIVDTATTVLIYTMLGLGLNIVVGLAGLLDLGYVAFYAIGAYSFALLATHYDFSFWMCLPIAGVMAAFLGIILGFPVLRLRGDYLAIVTLGFGEIIRIILINWGALTGGPNGITNIPRPSFFGAPFTRTAAEGEVPFHELFGLSFSSMHRVLFLYYLILVLVVLTAVIAARLRRLPIGRAWEALREDEVACRALGVNATRVKLSAFAIGAMFGGFAGTFFATRQGFISPESFTFIESALVLAIVVLGGMGSQLGVALAAIIVVALPEMTREFAELRMLLFGAAMVLVMVWRPRGLIGTRRPSVTLARFTS